MEIIDEVKRLVSENKKLKKKEIYLEEIISSRGKKFGLGNAFLITEMKKDIEEMSLHIKWLSDRLVYKYGESPLCDYHIKSQAMGEKWKS